MKLFKDDGNVSMTERRFVELLKGVFDEVYMPLIDEMIKRNAEDWVKTIVYKEMAEEVRTEIRAQVSKAVRENINVSVRVVDRSLPPGI